MYEIKHREDLGPDTFLWEVSDPDLARAAKPGQFIILRLNERGERVPLTIADYDRDAGTITLVIQAIGKSTKAMQRLPEGATFMDMVGPLGLETHMEKHTHVVMVGGGLGVAPIYPQLRAFHELGCKTTAIIGFRTEDRIFWQERFEKTADQVIVCTDDGSAGYHGFVNKALEQHIKDNPDVDHVVAIGPLPMMHACAKSTERFGIKTIVSLNAIMVDGTGMCGSCRVRVGGVIKFACVDGPDFDAHLVDFDELSIRQRRFHQEERQADEEFEVQCNLLQAFEPGVKTKPKKIKEVSPHKHHMPERTPEDRRTNFREVNLGYDWQTAMDEADRCLFCKKPLCIDGCPVHIDIPAFIRHIQAQDMAGARRVLETDNVLPSVCGRVCPQETQCEKTCVIGAKVDPVAIGHLERFVADHAPPVVRVVDENGLLAGKRIAVVGSGPGGLACAGDCARHGAEVVVFEALHVAGGVLQYGIPSFRLPRDIIKRELAGLEEMGVEFRLNRIIGKLLTPRQLFEEKGFDAVFIATGAGMPTFLGLQGEAANGVYSANEFLTRINLMGADNPYSSDTPVMVGNKVVVLGAGNTAMDCLRVALRMGAEEVTCVYRRTRVEAPARVEEVRHAEEEGIRFHWLAGPVSIDADEAGNVRGIMVQQMELGEPDSSGRRRPVPTVDPPFRIECDQVIYALGTKANPIISQSMPDLKTNKWGYIEIDKETGQTSVPQIFAGGDIVTGAATVIEALGAGRTAAQGIVNYLSTGSARMPT